MCTTAHMIYGEKYKCPKWTNTYFQWNNSKMIKWHMEILSYRCENGKGWSMTFCHMEISPMRCGLGKGWSMSETVARRSPAKPPFRPNPPTIGDQHHKWSTNFDFISQEKINELSAFLLLFKKNPLLVTGQTIDPKREVQQDFFSTFMLRPLLVFPWLELKPPSWSRH